MKKNTTDNYCWKEGHTFQVTFNSQDLFVDQIFTHFYYRINFIHKYGTLWIHNHARQVHISTVYRCLKFIL